MQRPSLVKALPVLGIVAFSAALSLPAGEEKKTPIPSKDALGKSEVLVKDIFGEDISKATTAEGRAKLAVVLLQQGDDSGNDAANRYVLYRDAMMLAARAGDANLTLQAIDKLDRHFAVNASELKATQLDVVAGHLEGREAGKALVDLVLPLIGEALDSDNYEAARQFGAVALKAAKKAQNVNLVLTVQKRNEEVAAVEKGFARLQPYVDALKKNPKDAEANLELGKYFGLLKGKWDRALPLLAMGGDEALNAQARKDLARPKSAQDQLDVADGWWDLARQEKDPAQLNLQRRAMHWYELAAVSLQGLNRKKALVRIDQVTARLAGSVVEGPPGPVGEIRKFEGHTDEIKSVAFSHDGRYAVSGGLDMTVRIWDLSTKEDWTLRGHTKQIWGVGFHPNGRQVFSASWDATARMWDFRAGSESKRFTHPVDVNGIAVWRDGGKILVGCDNQSAYLWNTVTGEEMRRFPGHTGYCYGTAFAPDGRHIATSSVDKTVRVYDLTGGTLVKNFNGHTDAVTSIAFSADSRFVFSCGDGVAHQWEIATGKETRRFEGHQGRVLGLAISPDGRRLLTGGDDKTVRLWDIASGKELYKYTGHADSVNAVAFSPDGRRALSAGLDRTVRLIGLPR